MTAPHPDGRGAYNAMRRALAHAGLRPSSIDYINAHATSTPLGDAIEYHAIQRLLAEDPAAGDGVCVPVSSTKGALGHLLGAAGAIEAVLTVLALHSVRLSHACVAGCRARL